jgi:signal transduction histidine kinase/DNA-binding response OmpR family regulator
MLLSAFPTEAAIKNVQIKTAPAMEILSDFPHARPPKRAAMVNSRNVLGSFLRAVFLLTSLVIAAIIIGEVYLSVGNIEGLAGREARILNTYQAKQEIQHLLVAADDMLLSTRHYLLLADQSYELQFDNALNMLRLSLDRLRLLTAESPSQQQRLDQIEQLFPALRDNFDRLSEVFRQSGYNGVAMLLERGEDIRRQDLLEELVRQLDNEQGALLLANIAADARQERQAWLLVALGSALSALVGLGAFLLLHRDLAQRRRIEAELADKTGLLQTTFDNIGQGLAVFDRNLKLVAWNRQFVEIFSLPASLAAVGRGYADFLRHRASRGEFGETGIEEHIEQLVAGMRAATNATLTGKMDGRSIEITRQRMPDGGTISTYSDITERKKVERTKDEFVSTVSHELRTPLTSIQGALGLIVGGALGPIPPEMKAMIDIAHSNSERLVRLINDILDIEKIESGGLEFRLQRQRLSPILRKSIEANATYAAKYNVRVRFEEGALDAEADVDADRLTQVMANLLTNAEKFSTPGDTVVVTLQRRGKILRISVTDHGPGIPVEFRDKIFGRFAQADTSDSRKKGGTGLGLSIVRALVERMHGTASFTSEVGAGSTFFVDLPDRSPSAQPSSTAAAGDARPARGQRVLLCEDDPELAGQMKTILTSDGFDVDLVSSASQARDALAEGGFAAMTLDFELPDEDGLKFFRTLRADDRYRSLPVVVVSADADEGQTEDGTDTIGVVDWIQKPIATDRLLRALRLATDGMDGALPRILHVEDDTDVANVVAGILGGLATIDRADGLRAAKHLIQTRPYDLVILDLAFPDGSGNELLPLLPEGTQIVVFSASEPSKEIARRAAAVLVKTRASNAMFLATIRQLLRDTASRGARQGRVA